MIQLAIQFGDLRATMQRLIAEIAHTALDLRQIQERKSDGAVQAAALLALAVHELNVEDPALTQVIDTELSAMALRLETLAALPVDAIHCVDLIRPLLADCVQVGAAYRKYDVAERAKSATL